jgi:gamma-glutamyltranspeptidase/glutathione hydrolase
MTDALPFGWDLPYPSRSTPVLARNVVATSQPLAVQAGMRMLDRGGSAADAAVATAIALVAVEPTNNGVGSDAFAIILDGDELVGLNASGRSPAAATPQRLAGHDSMPLFGWDTVTVPGAVSAWKGISDRFGRLPFRDLFEPAIEYARDGCMAAPMVAEQWRLVAPLYCDMPDFGRVFLPNGEPPAVGERFIIEGLARTLERIADSDGEDFYRGELAAQIVAHSQATGGCLSGQDLQQHRADWVKTIGVDYGDWTLHELPPNGQGLAALIAMGLLSRLPLRDFAVDSADSIHLQMEAMKIGAADAKRYVADAEFVTTQPADLLRPAYLDERASQIDLARAADPGPGAPLLGDTVYLTTADQDGMMVSYIQSNFFAFGSGIVVPGTGISLQNRGAGFSLEHGHANCLGPSKRPFHTIIPAFLSRGGKPVMSFGVMGGPMQPQGHVQVAIRIAEYGQNPQAAIDAPRWQTMGGLDVAVEQVFPTAVCEELARRGHRVRTEGPITFGGAQACYRMPDGYLAASEPRKDGHAAGK